MRCALIAHLVALSILAGCGGGAPSATGGPPANGPPASGPPASGPQAVPVTTATVVVKDMPLTVRAIGQLQASQLVIVRPQIGGPLRTVSFREGDTVSVGQPLFSIDPRPAQQALRQAQAAHERSQADVRQAQAVLVRDRALVTRAKTEAERSSSLLQKGMITPSADEQTQVVYQAALAVIEADEASIAAAQATVAANVAAIEEAQLRVSYCEVLAPLAGRTGALAIDAGNVVTANQTALVTIAQIQPLYVSFTVPETLLPQLQTAYAAKSLTVTLSDSDEKGAVHLIENQVDPTTGTIRLRAELANATSQRLPGQFADVQLTLGVESAVMVVPVEAVQSGQQGRFVYVIEPSGEAGTPPRVALRLLRVLRVSGGEAVVAEGVKAGDHVVLDGHVRLLPGTLVQVVPLVSPTGAPTAAGDSETASPKAAGAPGPARP